MKPKSKFKFIAKNRQGCADKSFESNDTKLTTELRISFGADVDKSERHCALRLRLIAPSGKMMIRPHEDSC